jgi:hypothetical protein
MRMSGLGHDRVGRGARWRRPAIAVLVGPWHRVTQSGIGASPPAENDVISPVSVVIVNPVSTIRHPLGSLAAQLRLHSRQVGGHSVPSRPLLETFCTESTEHPWSVSLSPHAAAAECFQLAASWQYSCACCCMVAQLLQKGY